MTERRFALPAATGTEEDGQVAPASTALVAAETRERAEIESALILARRFPRNETEAGARVLQACRIHDFAEAAVYEYPRGGTTVSGLSISFAREAARCWGNIRSGFRVTDWTPERTSLEGFALDLETNTLTTAGISFGNSIFRKGKNGEAGRWIVPDEREYRELVGRQGAVLVRNCILSLLPPDLKVQAEEEIRTTKRTKADRDLSADRDGTLRKLLVAFDAFGVTAAMIEARYNCPTDALTVEHVTELRGIYNALKDAQAKREEFFDPPTVKPAGQEGAPAAPKAPSAADKLAAMAGATPTPAPAPAPPAAQSAETAPPAADTSAPASPSQADPPEVSSAPAERLFTEEPPARRRR